MTAESNPPIETEDEKRAREAEEARVAANEAAQAAAEAEAAAAAKRAEEAAEAIRAAQAEAEAAAAAEAKAAKDALAASLKANDEAMGTAETIIIPEADEIHAPAGPDGKPKFGPTFSAELKAADCLGLLYSYDEARGVLMFDPGISVADRAKVVAVVEAHDPTKELPKIFTVAKIDVYRQLTDAEFSDLDAKVKTQPLRIQGIYNTAVNFVSDSPEYGLLMQMATELYGADRAKALLGWTADREAAARG